MACHLFIAKPVQEVIVNWTCRYKLEWNAIKNKIIFIQENAFEIVIGNVADILLRVPYVNSLWPSYTI